MPSTALFTFSLNFQIFFPRKKNKILSEKKQFKGTLPLYLYSTANLPNFPIFLNQVFLKNTFFSKWPIFWTFLRITFNLFVSNLVTVFKLKIMQSRNRQVNINSGCMIFLPYWNMAENIKLLKNNIGCYLHWEFRSIGDFYEKVFLKLFHWIMKIEKHMYVSCIINDILANQIEKIDFYWNYKYWINPKTAGLSLRYSI